MRRPPSERTWGDGPAEGEALGSLTEAPELADALQGFATFGDGADGEEGEVVLPEELPGRYVFGDELGRGGIGAVRVALDRHLGRRVARKELLRAARPADRARFLREARVTAALEHPNVVPVHELGVDAQGNLYYTMRQVRGRNLREALADCASLADRLGLIDHFVDLCNAIAYAHDRGVVHRDLKPDNVMVGPFGETVVLDWGLARVAGAPEAAEPARDDTVIGAGLSAGHVTRVGSAIGTPAYMSPEQAQGWTDALDERADVWGLGAVLFELLTGHPPYEGAPTAIIARLRALDPPDLRALADAPPELRAIVTTALQPDRERRYRDARALAADIAAWQRGERVSSYSYSAWGTLTRLVRRHRDASAVALAAGLALLGLAAWSYARVAAERDRARDAEAVAEAGAQEARAGLARALLRDALERLADDDLPGARALGAASLALAESPAARGVWLAGLAGSQPRRLWSAPLEARCESLRLSPDGALLACGTLTDLALYPTAGGPPRRLPLVDDNGWGYAFTPDGAALLATGSAGLRAHRLSDGAELRRWPVEGLPLGVAARRGGGLAVGLEDGAVLAFEDGGALRHRLGIPGGRAYAVAFDPEGARLAAAGGGGLAVWRWDDGAPVPLPPDAPARGSHLAWSGDELLVADWVSESPELWAGAPGAPAGRVFAVHAAEISALAAASSTPRWAAGDEAGGLRVGRLDGAALARLPTEGGAVHGLAFAPDGAHLAVATPDSVSWWELPAQWEPARAVAAGPVVGLAFAGPALRIATADGSVRRWSAELAELMPTEARFEAGCRAWTAAGEGAVAALDGGRLVATDADGWIRWSRDLPAEAHQIVAHREQVWVAAGGAVNRYGLAAGEPEAPWSPPVHAWALGWTREGARLWVSDANDGRWAALHPDGTTAFEGRFGDDRGQAVAASPTADRVALGSRDGQIYLVHAHTGALEQTLEAHPEGVVALAWSPDGRLLASGGDDGGLVLWRASDGRRLAELPGHGTSAVWGLAFSADGASLASGSGDGQLRRWGLGGLATSGAEALEAARQELGFDPLAAPR